MKRMPCGFERTGKMADHLAHYRVCSDPSCVARLVAWEEMKTLFKKEQAAKRTKGESK